MQTPSTLNDIVFESRNRAYGAYLLRQRYQPTLTRALGLGVGLFLLGVSAPTLYARLNQQTGPSEYLREVTLENARLDTPPAEKPVELPPVEELPTPKTVRSLPPEVLPDNEVTAADLPPTVEELAEATPSDQTREGTGDETAIIAPPEEAVTPTKTESAIDVTPEKEPEFLAVEQQPEFAGGLEALTRYLTNNLKYPRQAAQAGISGRVYVGFVVNSDGSLTDVQVLKGIGFGCDEEARRVVQQMPRWKPGRQSGRPVRVRFTLPIAFTLE